MVAADEEVVGVVGGGGGGGAGEVASPPCRLSTCPINSASFVDCGGDGSEVLVLVLLPRTVLRPSVERIRAGRIFLSMVEFVAHRKTPMSLSSPEGERETDMLAVLFETADPFWISSRFSKFFLQVEWY